MPHGVPRLTATGAAACCVVAHTRVGRTGVVTEIDSSEWTDTPEQKRKRAIKRAKECVVGSPPPCVYTPHTTSQRLGSRRPGFRYALPRVLSRLAEQKEQRRKKAMRREAALREGRVFEEEKPAPSKWQLMDMEAQKFNEAYNKAHRPESLMAAHKKRVRRRQPTRCHATLRNSNPLPLPCPVRAC